MLLAPKHMVTTMERANVKRSTPDNLLRLTSMHAETLMEHMAGPLLNAVSEHGGH